MKAGNMMLPHVFLGVLKDLVAREGLIKTAEDFKMNPEELGNMLQGKTQPSDGFLTRFKLRKITVYEYIGPDTDTPNSAPLSGRSHNSN